MTTIIARTVIRMLCGCCAALAPLSASSAPLSALLPQLPAHLFPSGTQTAFARLAAEGGADDQNGFAVLHAGEIRYEIAKWRQSGLLVVATSSPSASGSLIGQRPLAAAFAIRTLTQLEPIQPAWLHVDRILELPRCGRDVLECDRQGQVTAVLIHLPSATQASAAFARIPVPAYTPAASAANAEPTLAGLIQLLPASLFVAGDRTAMLAAASLDEARGLAMLHGDGAQPSFRIVWWRAANLVVVLDEDEEGVFEAPLRVFQMTSDHRLVAVHGDMHRSGARYEFPRCTQGQLPTCIIERDDTPSRLITAILHGDDRGALNRVAIRPFRR